MARDACTSPRQKRTLSLRDQGGRGRFCGGFLFTMLVATSWRCRRRELQWRHAGPTMTGSISQTVQLHHLLSPIIASNRLVSSRIPTGTVEVLSGLHHLCLRFERCTIGMCLSRARHPLSIRNGQFSRRDEWHHSRRQLLHRSTCITLRYLAPKGDASPPLQRPSGEAWDSRRECHVSRLHPLRPSMLAKRRAKAMPPAGAA